MPAHLLAIPSANKVQVQFTDSNGNNIGVPEGAKIEWSANPENTVKVTVDPGSPALAALAEDDSGPGGMAIITAKISGVSDGGTPFPDLTIQVTIYRATPARFVFG